LSIITGARQQASCHCIALVVWPELWSQTLQM